MARREETMRSLSIVVIVVVTALASGAALAVPPEKQGKAQDKKGADPAVEQAKKYFQLGTVQYDLGNYPAALDAFEQARALKPLPGFLFNIGQCHRRMGNHDEAIRFYEQYLAEVPAAPNKKDVVELLAEAKKARAEARENAAATPATRAPPAVESAPADSAANIAAEPLVPAASTTTTPGEGTDMMLWAAVGGGAAALLAGGVVLVALLPSPSNASLGRVDLRGAQ